jgi:hypothetical protein
MQEVCPSAATIRVRAMVPPTLFSLCITKARVVTKAQDLRIHNFDDHIEALLQQCCKSVELVDENSIGDNGMVAWFLGLEQGIVGPSMMPTSSLTYVEERHNPTSVQ